MQTDIGTLANAVMPQLEKCGDYFSRQPLSEHEWLYRNQRTGQSGTLSCIDGKPQLDGELFAGIDVKQALADYAALQAALADENTAAELRLEEQRAQAAAEEQKTNSKFARARKGA